MKKKVVIVFGTRPEAIKLAPVIRSIRNSNFILPIIICTGQHKSMFGNVLKVFNIKVDYDLQIMKKNQSLCDITCSVLTKISQLLDKIKPSLVLVHGDTTSSFSCALASFYKHIPVAHIEAGLRTYNKYSPFPEEFNRQAITSLSNYHFAPTKENYLNLVREGVDPKYIYITGNTSIDLVKHSIEKCTVNSNIINNEQLLNKKLILLTAHRRENLGEKIRGIFSEIRRLAINYKENIIIIYPVHLNPTVSKDAFNYFKDIENIKLIKPLDTIEFHYLMSKCYFILTDSGGIQEEAAYLGKPVIVMRDTSERKEAVKDKVIHVVGTNGKKIYDLSEKLILDKNLYECYANRSYVFGDGNSSKKIVLIIEKILSNKTK